MKDIVTFLQEIEYQKKNELSFNDLTFIKEEISKIFSEIKKCEDADSASTQFEKIDRIQFYLARLSYKEHLFLPEFLNQFVSTFDRIDDKRTREIIYSEIKNGRFLI